MSAAAIFQLNTPRAAAAETAKVDPRTLGADCDRCPLKGKKVILPSPATKKLKLVIVGEAPGRMEEHVGKPFMGPSGSLLNSLLASNGFDRAKAHVTNTLLCRPESEDQILPAQGACSGRLFRELRDLDPSVPILALGAEATKALLPTRSVMKARGFVWTIPSLTKTQKTAARASYFKAKKKKKVDLMATALLKLRRNVLRGRVVLPTLHPAFVLRSEIWSAIIRIDIARALRFVRDGGLQLEDEADFTIISTPREILAAGRNLGSEVTVDIETDGVDPLTCNMICVGIGNEKTTYVIWPWRKGLVKALSKAFRRKSIIGHNVIGFDAIVLRRLGVWIDDSQLEDTMIAHHAFASHFPKSLLHVASVYCTASPWKQKAKGEGKSEKGLPHQLSPEDLTKYNAADVVLTARSWDRMRGDVKAERRVYEIGKNIGALCTRMRIRGFPFDVDRARELTVILQRRKMDLLYEMREICGDENFKPSKAFDLRQVLFGQLDVPIIRLTPKGLPATGREVLEQLRNSSDRAGRFSDLVLRWRDAAKTISTYLKAYVHPDGRVHGDWRIGPVSGRLACRQMTLPRYSRDKKTGVVDATDRVRECFVASKGCRLVYFDLSQAEMRVAANLSGDPVFIASCKGDVHAGNAKVLFPDVAAKGWLDGDEAKKGRGAPFRDIAKNVGFAIAYLAEWETVFAYLAAHGFPTSALGVREMLDRLHTAYAVYYEYVKKNVEFVQKHGYLRSPLHGRIRWFGHFPKPTEVANCYDEKTEALTQRGWVQGFDLKPGDKLLTKNKETGTLKWEPIARLQLYEKYTGPMYEFRSRTFNAVTTAEHRWLVTDRRAKVDRTATTKELADRAYVGDLSIHRTGAYEGPRTPYYTDDLVTLAGWILTDGSVVRGRTAAGGEALRIVLYQTKRQGVVQIDALFRRLQVKPLRREHDRGAVRWTLTGGWPITRLIHRLFPARTLTQEFLDALTRKQLRLLFDTMMLGDGSQQHSHTRFTCRDKARVDIFQTLCTLLGMASNAQWRGPARPKKQYTTIANRPQSKGVWVVSVLNRNTAQVIRHRQRYGKNTKAVDHVRVLPAGQERRVWCPVVRNNFFVVRRKGDVYISSNSPIQSCIADLMNDRLLEVEDRLPNNCYVLGQYHDAAIFEVPTKLEGDVKGIIRSVYDPPVVLPNGRSFYIPIDLKSAERMSEL